MDAIHMLGLGDLVRENRRRFPGGTALVDGDQRLMAERGDAQEKIYLRDAEIGYPVLPEQACEKTLAGPQHGHGELRIRR